MSVHGATPYCRWVFEAVAIVGTAAPANRRFFQKRWLQLKFVRAFRRSQGEFSSHGVLVQVHSTEDESVASALSRQYRDEPKVPNGRQRPEHTRKCEVVNKFARRDVRSNEVPLRSARA